MELIKFKPIAFLLKLSAEYFSLNNIKEDFNFSVNKNLSLSTNVIVASKIQQKSIGICVSKEHILQIKKYILHNIFSRIG
ncbi:MAG: hypothetical protein COA67_10230 [Lutibacter sp.]|nr:MAG: hypothetical protein COA67_10230 [Lutibacter sp.]